VRDECQKAVTTYVYNFCLPILYHKAEQPYWVSVMNVFK